MVGCFMRLGSPGETLDTPIAQPTAEGATLRIGKQGCCSINDAEDARRVAGRLDVPFYVCNFKKDFGRIIDYFVDEYNAGHPQSMRAMQRLAEARSAARLRDATQRRLGGVRAPRPGRTTRRQSTTLHGARRGQGSELRAFAPPWSNSTGCCFRWASSPRRKCGRRPRRWDYRCIPSPTPRRSASFPTTTTPVWWNGRLRMRSGKVKSSISTGRSSAITRTPALHHRPASGHRCRPRAPALRRGRMRTPTGSPWARSSPSVGRLHRGGIQLARTDVPDFRPCTAKIRYNAAPVPARVRERSDGVLEVRFDTPQESVAPGQAVVCYEDDMADRGGWIKQAIED